MSDTDSLTRIVNVLSSKPRYGIGVNQQPDINGYIRYVLPDNGIKLNADVTYLAYIAAFTAPNTIQNIYTGINDKFYYTNSSSQSKTLTIPAGYYSPETYNSIIQSQITANGDTATNIVISINLPTLQIQLSLANGYSVDFTKPNSNYLNMGFNKQVYTVSSYSSISPNFFPQDTLLLSCDIVEGMYYNNVKSNIMEIIPMIAPSGGKLIYMPNPVREWKVNKQQINDIIFRITDQNKNPVLQTIENVIISLIIHQV